MSPATNTLTRDLRRLSRVTDVQRAAGLQADALLVRLVEDGALADELSAALHVHPSGVRPAYLAAAKRQRALRDEPLGRGIWTGPRARRTA